MPPKNTLLLISQCLRLSHCFRFLFCINFIAVKISTFHILQLHFLTNCEQNNFLSEKSLIPHEMSTGIRYVTKDWHLFYSYHYAKEWFQITNPKRDEKLFLHTQLLLLEANANTAHCLIFSLKRINFSIFYQSYISKF